MAIKQYTGWWDEIPSHWTPAIFEMRSAEIVALAGRIAALEKRARSLRESDIVMASHLADWAWFAEPGNPLVQQRVLDIYSDRMLDERSNNMEMLAYLEAMTLACQAQLDAGKVAEAE